MKSDAEKMAELIGKDAADLLGLLIESQDLQWQRPRNAAPGEAPAPRGVHGDPTAHTALDGRRLAVRDARQRAIEELVKAYTGLSNARSNLSSAIEKWRS